ncbi:MAG: hypothetical protein R3355_16665 [Pseudomonas sp.]|uniref:hypothetical protein n=1 Tax=Pseudomonas sp. TaxID=306 RepID=UPI00299E2DA8|nr:hypothetical protein [Pseudomonas sp.]MDX1724734.1 hypothetical protein [Pseudomonas sp.]
MSGMTDSSQVQRINAQCNRPECYLHKPSGVRYSAAFEAGDSYALDPIYGQSKHATTQDLANAEIWERLS